MAGHHHHRSYPKQIHNLSLKSSSAYTTHLINYTTTNSTMEHLIKQVIQTQLFTIATENDCLTNMPALIQIECVSQTSTIILIECWHLPKPHSRTFSQISLLFRSIFKSSNEIQGWGDLSIALKPFVKFNLFSLSNIQDTHFADVQQSFREWYNRNFPHSEGCRPSEGSLDGEEFIYLHPTDSDRNLSSLTEQYDYLPCSCSHRPYKNPDDNWSLHAAVQATFQKNLDNKMTSSHWGLGLGFILDLFIPKHLDGKQRFMQTAKEKEYRRHLIEYAAHICISITKLSVAIRHRWSKQDIERHIQSTHIQANPPGIFNTESSTISPDPIILTTNDTTTDHQPISDGHIVDAINADTSVSIVPFVPEVQSEIHKQKLSRTKKKNKRSLESILKHHKKRKAAQRARLRACRIMRQVYHKFTKEQVEQILDELQIHRRRYYIGPQHRLCLTCHSPADKIRYNDLLGSQYFTERHYNELFGSTCLSSQMNHLLSDACQQLPHLLQI